MWIIVPGDGEGTPYNELNGEVPLERGTFFRLQVYEKLEVLPVDLWKGREIRHFGL